MFSSIIIIFALAGDENENSLNDGKDYAVLGVLLLMISLPGGIFAGSMLMFHMYLLK